ncbi:hypothetical protein, partial [Methanocalculus sp.]|uniref:hypothetical protein n=1 Tax=Methanocalculus sp. TaxID=2004547 RepID=UPI0026361F37
VMFRKEFAESIGGYNEGVKWALDFDFYHRASKAGRLYRMDEVLVQWRTMPAKSEEKSRGQMETVYGVLRNNFARMGVGEVDEAALAILNNQHRVDEAAFTCPDIECALATLLRANAAILKTAPPFLSRPHLFVTMAAYSLFFVRTVVKSHGFTPVLQGLGSARRNAG